MLEVAVLQKVTLHSLGSNDGFGRKSLRIESREARRMRTISYPGMDTLIPGGNPHAKSIVPELAYISLGSNLGDRAANLREAIERLAKAAAVRAVSLIYEAEPVDVADQPWFLNCVVAIETDKSPAELIKTVLSIEETMGRRRTREKGPRTIDIDIVLFGDRVVEQPGLSIPHPAMHRRRFVLEPLTEIAPEVRHPLLHRTARELLDALPPGPCVKILGT